jgi:putative MFS transporter
MTKSGLFTPESLGFLAMLKPLAIAGVGTFVFCTFSGLWLGTFLFGFVADRFGRRVVFTWSLIWYIVCTAVMAFQTSGLALDIWRVIAGIGIGVELITLDTYISELIPGGRRGAAFAMNQAIMFCAVPLVAFLAYIFEGTSPFGLDYWRIVILFGSVGAVVVWILRRHVPESPRWLVQRGRLEEAERITAELERKVIAETGKPLPTPVVRLGEHIGVGAAFEMFSPQFRRRTILMSIFNLAQVIGFYGFAAWVPTLLVQRGIHITTSLRYAFIIAIANPFGPLLGAWFADRLERKTQVVIGLGIMGVTILVFSQMTDPAVLIVLGVLFTLASNFMSFAYHGYQTEIFPTRIRSRAVGFVYSWSRISAAFAGLIIGNLLHYYGVPGVAVFIAIAMVVAAVMVLLGPPTSGRALEEIST